MRVWRLAKKQHQALDGEGARLYGGRWNSPGVPVVYTAATLSLALLEQFVRIDPDEIPDDFVSIAIHIPQTATIEYCSQAMFPKGWQQSPVLSWFKAKGDDWLARQESLVLIVPSVIVPEESNILLNPRHPQMKQVTLEEVKPFVLDMRLF